MNASQRAGRSSSETKWQHDPHNGLQSPCKKVKSQWARPFLENLKARFLHACGPPGRAARAAVHEQRPEGEFGPRLIGDYHEQKISAGDVDLMIMTDDPREAARIVVDAYEAQQHPDAPRLEKV